MQDTIEDRKLFIRIFNAWKSKTRDIQLEHDLLNSGDADAACLYAIRVIRGAWPNAEHIIGKSAVWGRNGSYLTRFPETDGTLWVSHPQPPKHPGNKTHINDPIHVDPAFKDKWGRSGTKLVVKSSSTIAMSYFRLTKKRLLLSEQNTEGKNAWYAKKLMPYVKLVHEFTGEIADFESGYLIVQVINQIKDGTFSKHPIPIDEKNKLITNLEQRLTLYSFATTQEDQKKDKNSVKAIKKYFGARAEATAALLELLGKHDDNTTVAELKKIILGGADVVAEVC